MRSVSFEVVGLPGPQGSKSPKGRTKSGRPIMVESSKKVAPWREAVANAGRDAMDGDAPMDGPLSLAVVFRLPMPASRPKRVREVGRGPSTVYPDLSKLVRSTEDALVTAGVIRDDARIACLTAEKVEVIGWTGAFISIERLPVTVWPAGSEPVVLDGAQ